VIAKILGEVDLSNSERIREELSACIGNDVRTAVVDLSETTYLDSVGIGLLFSLGNVLRTRRQELRLIVPPRSMLDRLLQLVDIPSVIQVYTDRESAVGNDN
jgi:anti-sigma B factor antagonist